VSGKIRFTAITNGNHFCNARESLRK